MNGDVFISFERAELSEFLNELEKESESRIEIKYPSEGKSLLNYQDRFDIRRCKVEPAKMIGQQLDLFEKPLLMSMVNDID